VSSEQRRCPACGEPLYGWINVRATDPRRDGDYVIDRCESCGLGLTRDGNAPSADELAPGHEHRIPNRASWQAGIGGEHWAALDVPARRLLLTPRSLELLLGRRGLRAARSQQTVFGRNQVWMWQTLINVFTFHDNFAREVVRRRLTPRSSRNVVAYAIDAAISLLAAIPIALVSVPLELVAVAARRGGELMVAIEPDAKGATAPARRSA
jgi:hypothetical protein